MTKNNEFNLIDAEDEYLSEYHNLAVRRQGLYPSEASVIEVKDGRSICRGKCLRAAYYRASGVSKTDPGGPSLSMKGNLGKAAEVMTIEKWKEMGIWIANNIKFFDATNVVSGELDAVIRNKINNNRIGIEIKSFYGNFANQYVCGSKGRRLKGGGYSDKQPRKVGQPKIDQFLQSVLYSHFYITLNNKLDEYWMYYIERGDGHRVIFRVGTELQEDGTHICWWEQVPGKYWTSFEEGKVYTSFTIEDVYSRYKDLITLLREKKLPPKDYTDKYDKEFVHWAYKNKEISSTKFNDWEKKGTQLGDWQCSYCDYKTQCQNEG